ncbi:hypothetical protein EMIHUDRAFT_124820, partial [Emiliania huxleyi CCMP1516]|uniref:Uncharacterized protein n=2 Tax=Emiliania huxleyi TaxID=2903 RepID=A0A0D3IFW1_EMIH1
ATTECYTDTADESSARVAIFGMPQQSTLAAAALASPPSPPLVCPCLTAYPAGVSLVSAEVHVVAADGVSLAYPGTYCLHGCDPHDSRLEPSCDSTCYPGWCEHEWCYVDPAACNTEYSTTAYVVGATPHYLCPADAAATAAAAALAAALASAALASPSPPPSPSPPSPPLVCPCLTAYPAGVSLVSAEVQVVAADGVSLAYPGTYCLHGRDPHDSGLEM